MRVEHKRGVLLKQQIKEALSRFGLFVRLDLIRRLPEIRSWFVNGCSGILPAPMKRLIISSYLRKYGLRQFIETGTFQGDTLAHIANDNKVFCTSIELAEGHYAEACRRFAAYPNVRLLLGDSGELLPELLQQLQGPALFWLDGHYSGDPTAKDDTETPVKLELAAILNSPIGNHVVLIDDARLFGGKSGYPHLDELLKWIRQNGRYEVVVSADIIRLTPKG